MSTRARSACNIIFSSGCDVMHIFNKEDKKSRRWRGNNMVRVRKKNLRWVGEIGYVFQYRTPKYHVPPPAHMYIVNFIYFKCLNMKLMVPQTYYKQVTLKKFYPSYYKTN